MFNKASARGKDTKPTAIVFETPLTAFKAHTTALDTRITTLRLTAIAFPDPRLSYFRGS